MSVPSLLIVDCQYDFIDGSLACEGALEAVDSATWQIGRASCRERV